MSMTFNLLHAYLSVVVVVLSGPQEVFNLKPQSFIAFHCALFKALLQLTIVAGFNEIKSGYKKHTKSRCYY